MKETASLEIELVNDGRIPLREGQSILDASLESGVPHLHACGGKGLCSTCRVLIMEGHEHLSPIGEAEQELSRKMNFSKNVRLACQAQVGGGPVKACRVIRDETDLHIVLGKKHESTRRTLGEERELALFFLDIRDFTPYVESNLPFDVIHVLSRFHALVGNAVKEGGGRVVMTAGDGVFAVFGLETEVSVGVAAALRAGRRILADLETFNDAYLGTHFGIRFSVGIGLHAGPVICGDVGQGVEGAFTALGHHVNVASRIESATKEVGNSFLVSEPAFRLLPEPPGGAPSAEVELKGVAGKMKVYLAGSPYAA